MRFASLPAGRFEMGCSGKGEDFGKDETRHAVAISRGFGLGVVPVTNAGYRQFDPKHRSGDYEGADLDGDTQPAVRVSWEDAVKYCEWLSAQPDERRAGRKYRLPTEAEWEYACRAGTATAYWWGDAFRPEACNFADRRTVALKLDWADPRGRRRIRGVVPGRFVPGQSVGPARHARQRLAVVQRPLPSRSPRRPRDRPGRPRLRFDPRPPRRRLVRRAGCAVRPREWLSVRTNAAPTSASGWFACGNSAAGRPQPGNSAAGAPGQKRCRRSRSTSIFRASTTSPAARRQVSAGITTRQLNSSALSSSTAFCE